MMINKNNFIIAIDGPAGAGKSTVAKKLANNLNFLYIDTGAMYRAITFKIIRNKIDLNDKVALKSMLTNTSLSYEGSILHLDGNRVGDEIRSNEVNSKVSIVSSNEHIRTTMTNLQRCIGKASSCIIDGRDIGTVVFPNADIKIFLVADLFMRAQRRYNENLVKGMNQTLNEIKKSITQRDYIDSNREISPLSKARDAIEIDTSNISIDNVVLQITNIYMEKINV